MSYRLVNYEAELGNVGDDFSPWLFEKALGEPSREDGDLVLFGVGSIFTKGFWNTVPFTPGQRVVVFGSGARGPTSPPPITEDWQVYCVRGPLTALAAGLSRDMYITDPGLLMSRLLPQTVENSGVFGIVPYYTSSESGWSRVADRLGWNLVSPRLPVESFAKKISECSAVFCESMHGAIFAESYGVPWRPLSGSSLATEKGTHAFKWTDWCSSMGVGFDPLACRVFSSQQGAGDQMKNFIKSEVIVSQLQKAAAEDRFVSASDQTRVSLQDRLLDKMNELSRNVTGSASRL